MLCYLGIISQNRTEVFRYLGNHSQITEQFCSVLGTREFEVSEARSHAAYILELKLMLI